MNTLCIITIFNWITEKATNLIMSMIEKIGDIAINATKNKED